ncbi:hypothetical protein [Anaerotignum sp. MB30-C6]|uniref:hypothetical protein n=1 Tax=Anaerotignum sp. MB30-C6 TaxID=3070814 RepID=UPI0027DE37BC|nr:hypothetical protein [Anaerotignum sp. MB30-C6]WMI81852.1 hypothetical protein RBQ60_03745 [Anaerotignum sp. MB30-C6]
MLAVIKTEVIDGYECIHYSNGAIVKKSANVFENKSTPEPLSPTEQAILQTAINTEYMAAMMEIKG